MPVSMDTAISNSMLMMASQVRPSTAQAFSRWLQTLRLALSRGSSSRICHVSDVIICKSACIRKSCFPNMIFTLLRWMMVWTALRVTTSLCPSAISSMNGTLKTPAKKSVPLWKWKAMQENIWLFCLRMDTWNRLMTKSNGWRMKKPPR